MAVLALAAAGAAAGAAIGGTFLGVAATSWGWMAGSMLGNALFGGTKTQGPRLGDLKFTGTEYGQPVPWVAGAPRISGQIIWASTKRELAKTESVGKGGGSEYTSYTYEIDLLILLSENVTAGVARVWSNGELVMGEGVTQSGVWSDLLVYTGAAGQLPDPTYEAAVGLGNAPAYRGRTTVLIRGLQLGSSGQVPNLTFEVPAQGVLSSDQDYQDKSTFARTATIQTGTINRFSGVGAQAGMSGPVGLFAGGDNVVPGRAIEYDFGGGTIYMPLVWSVSAVVLDNNTLGASVSNYIITFGNIDGYSPGLWIYRTNAAEGNVLRVHYRGHSYPYPTVTLETPAAAPFGTPYKIDVVFSGAWVGLYVDNLLVASDAAFNPSLHSLPISVAALSIGGRFGWSPCWSGAIDDVVIKSSSALSAYPYTADASTLFHVPFGSRQWLTPDPQPLQDVVDQLMDRAGYQPDEWDSSDLAAEARPVRSMALAQVGTTRAALETLASAYFFHASKGDQIVLRRRASATPAAIAWADLATAEDATAQGEPFALNTGSDMEVPAQVALTYPNMAGDYSAATEHSARLLGSQDSTQAVQLGLGMIPAEAKLVADALLFDQVTAMVTASISLPPTYSHVQAGDVLLVPDGRGRTHRMLVDRRTDIALVAQLDLRQDDPTALESESVTDTGYALTDNVRQLAPTWWQALDVPLLRDGDDAPGYYVAMAPNKAAATDIWRGAVLVRAWLPEQWETVATTDQAATLGATTSALPAWTGRNTMDEATVLTVRVSGQLASTTRDALQADRTVNTLLVGSEVLRFRQADLLGTTDGENDYRLTGLLRAQLGTEWAATAGAASGARVVLLGAALRRVTDQASQVGTPAEVKAVSQGLLLSSATAAAFTNTAVCLKPLAPVHLRAAPSGGDLAITWQRRTRLGYRYGGAAGVAVPLGEETEAYRVRLYSGSTLLRTLDATTPAATYTAAQQSADGLTSGAAITLQVVQRSATVGDGYPATLATTTP